jgi:hypothetical protein
MQAKLCRKWRNGMVLSAVLLVIGRVQKKNSATALGEGLKEIKRMEKHEYTNLLVYNVHAKQR